MKCQARDCPAEAPVGLALNVPAKGCPIAEHDPIQVVIGLQLCQRHLAEVKPEEFFRGDWRLEQLVRIQARGRAEPDFKRAFVSAVRLDSEEWKALQKARGGRE